jgi:hypothetical protein
VNEEFMANGPGCERCGGPLRRSVGRPARYCSVRCRQQAYRRRRRQAERRVAGTLGRQVQDLAKQLEDNTRLIRILVRGWTPPDREASPNLTELGQTARELAAALSRVCSRLDGGSVTASSADETGGRVVPETHIRRV